MPKRVIRTSSLVSLAVAAALAASAHAQDPSVVERVAAVDVPAGSLAEALELLARQSGVEFVYRSEEIAGLRTAGVHGQLSPQQAVIRLIEGTRLRLRTDSSGVLLISEAPDPAQTPVGAAVAADGRLRLAQAGAEAPPGDDLEEVVVSTQRFNYNIIESANKIPLSVKDTPQSVRIVTGDMLNFSGVTRINDLYKLDAGAHASNSYDVFVFASSRGFVTGGNEINAFKVDGFRAYDYFQFDFATYERMEIVKGSTSTLYGQAGLTGTINLISKKPQKEFGGYTSLEVGDYDYYRVESDLYGPLTEDGRLSGRMIVAYLDRDSSLRGNFKRQLTVAPSLQYELTPGTTLLLQVNYQTAEFAPSSGLGVQFLGGDDTDGANYVAPQVSRSAYAYYPWSEVNKDALVVNGVVEHRFANDWQLRGAVNYSSFQTFTSAGHIYNTDPDPDRAGEFLSAAETYIEDSENASYGGEVSLFGDVELFGREHTLFFGADYARVTRDFPGYAFTNVSDGTTFNIIKPDFSLIAEAHSLRDYLSGGIYGSRDWVGLYRLNSHIDVGGLTAQAVLKPLDRLSVLLGARYSQSESFRSEVYEEGPASGFGTDFFETPLAPEQKIDALDTSEVTFQAGLTFRLTDDVNGTELSRESSRASIFSDVCACSTASGLESRKRLGSLLD